jgi:hypothetical protein
MHAGNLTARELSLVFNEAAELKSSQQVSEGAGAGESAALAPSKKRKKEEPHPYRETIGIGNVGKRGGADTRGGVTVKTVDLCNYIYNSGGWESVCFFPPTAAAAAAADTTATKWTAVP